MAYSLPWTDLSLVCMPLRTLDELVNYYKNPVQWKTLVEPLAPRAGPRKYTEFDEDSVSVETTSDGIQSGVIDKESRREILVCHDFKGNWLIVCISFQARDC